ncbi:hypothetical protein COCCADRAFT_81140 [Bipolaris zeicola 26-R-13]|uniref:Uncharacterized protein n=1 Tax=Cochliobolus carbonum (strain 26-R-13) TaxID=930089 RepID=W6YIJ4_COCC2|nr:uncharacterized protein COCCADRAFT_81140 [Bipolaris zeicola 26-R-13]EUC39132.1 hypothetical protein COCCADRAFT_81140 [Bipolaris zeicola 26-R-13]
MVSSSESPFSRGLNSYPDPWCAVCSNALTDPSGVKDINHHFKNEANPQNEVIPALKRSIDFFCQADGTYRTPIVKPFRPDPPTWPSTQPYPEDWSSSNTGCLIAWPGLSTFSPALQGPIEPPTSKYRLKNQEKEEPYEKLGSAALLEGSVPYFGTRYGEYGREIDTNAVCRFFDKNRMGRQQYAKEDTRLIFSSVLVPPSTRQAAAPSRQPDSPPTVCAYPAPPQPVTPSAPRYETYSHELASRPLS